MEDPVFPVPEVNNLVNLNRTVSSCIEYHVHHPCPIFMHRFAPSMIF